MPGSAAGAVNARAARLRTNKQIANNFILFELFQRNGLKWVAGQLLLPFILFRKQTLSPAKHCLVIYLERQFVLELGAIN